MGADSDVEAARPGTAQLVRVIGAGPPLRPGGPRG